MKSIPIEPIFGGLCSSRLLFQLAGQQECTVKIVRHLAGRTRKIVVGCIAIALFLTPGRLISEERAQDGSKFIFGGYLGGWVWTDVARNSGLAAVEARKSMLLLRLEIRGDDNPDYGPTYLAGVAVGVTRQKPVWSLRPYLLGSIAVADASELARNLAVLGVGLGLAVGRPVGVFAEFRHSHFTGGRGHYRGLIAGVRIGG